MLKGVVAGTRIVQVDHAAKSRRVGRILSFGGSKYRVAWEDGERTVEDRQAYRIAEVRPHQCKECGHLSRVAVVWGEHPRCPACKSERIAVLRDKKATTGDWDGEFPVELDYTQGMDSKRKRKVFKSQSELDKWMEKNGDDIQVNAWSTDRVSASRTTTGGQSATFGFVATNGSSASGTTLDLRFQAAPKVASIPDLDPLMQQLLDEEGLYDYENPDIIKPGTDGMGTNIGSEAYGLGGTHVLVNLSDAGRWLYYKGWENSPLVAKIRDWSLYEREYVDDYDYEQDEDEDMAFSTASVRDPELAKSLAAVRFKIQR